jgi:flagellar basal-body rod protein FlgF
MSKWTAMTAGAQDVTILDGSNPASAALTGAIDMEFNIGSAAQAAIRLDQKFDIIANHLANVATTGFKAENVTFDDHFRAHFQVDMAQGTIEPTGNPLDLAISGEGFFKVRTPNGDRYTRNGAFTIDKEKYLVTQQGYRVLGEKGPIRLDGSNVAVDKNGQIEVDGTPTGKLKIVTFKDLENIQKEGGSLFLYKGKKGVAAEVTPQQMSVTQRALEQSNVSAVQEMCRMISTNRDFESFQKVIQNYDEMDTKAASDVGLVR